MRIFIAIEVPEKIKEKLREIQEEFKEEGKINFVKDFHLTLKFLGEISNLKIERVKERLKGMEVKPFELQLSKLGVFPSNNFIRVLWIGVKPEGKVKEIQSRIEEKLRDMFGVDKRFSAHITLGRVKFVEDKEKFVEKLKEVEGSFKVKSFKLIKSVLEKEGAKYEILEEFK